MEDKDFIHMYVPALNDDVYVDYELYNEGDYDDTQWDDLPDEIEIIKDPEFKILGVYDMNGHLIEETDVVRKSIINELTKLYWDDEPWRYN